MGRKAIRQDVVSRLKNSSGLTAIVPAAQIHDSKTNAIRVGKLPAIVVFVSRSRRVRDEAASGLPLFKVTHSIGIDCFGTGDTDALVAANVDDIAEAVLESLLTAGDWVAQFEELSAASEEIVIEGGDERRGLSRITFEAMLSDVYEPLTDSLGPIVDLSTVHIDIASDPAPLVHRSILFDDVDDYAVDSGDSIYSFGDGSDDSPFTISLWFKRSSVSAWGVLASKGNDMFGLEWKVEIGWQKTLSLTLNDVSANKAQTRYTDAVVPSDTNWHHVFVAYTGLGGGDAADGILLYIDGVLAASSTSKQAGYTAMSHISGAKLAVGARDHNVGSSIHFGGHIADLSIFNADLSASASDIYNLGEYKNLKNITPQPVSWWRMGSNTLGESPDFEIVDEMGRNNLTMSNFSGDATSGLSNESPFTSSDPKDIEIKITDLEV